MEVYALWLRGRANGVLITFGRPKSPLSELARQAAAAITLADRYTDVFALAQRRKQPKAAAEIQQSLLPPAHLTGHGRRGGRQRAAELRGGGRLVRRDRERRRGLGHAWPTGSGGPHAPRPAARWRSGRFGPAAAAAADIGEAMVVMHQTLREMPGPRAEMTAVDSALGSCDAPAAGGQLRPHGPAGRATRTSPWSTSGAPASHGLGGRASAKPQERSTSLESGDRLVMVSDGVINSGDGQAGLGIPGVAQAALRSHRATGADTVREIHRAVLEAADGDLKDDATAVCLAVL